MKHSALPFEVVALAFADYPRPSQIVSSGEAHDYSAEDLKRLSRQARTRAQCLHLADFYQSRRRMWIKHALEELDRLESGDRAERSPRSEAAPEHGRGDVYQYHLRQAAKSAAHSMRYLRRADLLPCSC
jgi:hypothetical protein